MADELLSTTDAARRLGISRSALYDWLSQSNVGQFMLRGQSVTIEYLQGGTGAKDVWIEAREVERLKELMRFSRVRCCRDDLPSKRTPGILVKLGRPNQ